MATGPGFYDNLTPQSWQDGSAATWTLQDPHQQSKCGIKIVRDSGLTFLVDLCSFRLPRKLDVCSCYVLPSFMEHIWNYGTFCTLAIRSESCMFRFRFCT